EDGPGIGTCGRQGGSHDAGTAGGLEDQLGGGAEQGAIEQQAVLRGGVGDGPHAGGATDILGGAVQGGGEQRRRRTAGEPADPDQIASGRRSWRVLARRFVVQQGAVGANAAHGAVGGAAADPLPAADAVVIEAGWVGLGPQGDGAADGADNAE